MPRGLVHGDGSLGDEWSFSTSATTSAICPVLFEVEQELDVRVEDGQPVVHRLVATRKPAGIPVTSEGIRRLPVAQFVQVTASVAALRITSTTGSGYGLSPVSEGDSEQEFRAVGGRRPIMRERMEQAAEIYRQALADGRPPAKAVGEKLGVSRSTVARLLKTARERGILEERDRG